MNRHLVLFLILFSLAGGLAAQGFVEPEVLTTEVLLSQRQAPPESELQMVLRVKIAPGLHINANTPTKDDLIPAVFQLKPSASIQLVSVVYPKPLLKKFAFDSEELAVYEGEVEIYATLHVSPQALPGVQPLEGVFSYQGCNESSCFFPAEVKFSMPLEIVPAGTPVVRDTSALSLGVKSVPSPPGDSAPKMETSTLRLTRDEQRAMEILERGLFYALAAFFLVGLALNLTPCVYPVIPLTVSYFGSQKGRSRGASFVSALFYLLGIALSFALLGILSGQAGKQWGFLFQSPWFVAVIVTIILLMAASMFGAFEISVPTSLLTRFGGAREGIWGALIMGLTVGVIIAPCAAGIIIGLVGLVAKLGLVAKGGLLFFAMGLGLGIPYLILATFSGLLNRLPQSGMWMLWVKKFFGFLLIGVALYFIIPQLEIVHDKLFFMLGLLGIVGGLLLGFFGQEGQSEGFTWFRRIFGGLLILMSLLWFNKSIEAKPAELPWIHYKGQSISELTAAGKPIFIDFYADWCAPCKQLDRETFSDSRVAETMAAFTLLKVDCTKPNAETRELMRRFSVSGMPTLLFLTPAGEEIPELREIGFIPPEKYLTSLQRALRTR